MARSDRTAVERATETQRAVESVWRIESARIVGSLARSFGSFDLAEEVAQEAVAEALVSWPHHGVPERPGAWLLTTARRRAIDTYRRSSGRDERYAAIASDATRAASADDEPWDPDAIDDDTLSLLFIACHPVLPREARISLTLRTVGGLTTEEIAGAFLIPIPTVQARITRAKRTLAAARVPFAVPPPDERRERIASVLNVIYVIFTEGSSATGGDTWIRHDLAREALRLARVLARLQPDPEPFGLLALLELTSARFPARTDESGRPILLEEQNRMLWDRSATRRGQAALARAGSINGLRAYGLQAAIAECHNVAESVATTNWERIVLLYEALRLVSPSPVVDLNHAVAVAMHDGPAAGLELVNELAARGALDNYHLLYVTRGELFKRLGRRADARGEFLRAAGMCTNEAERAHIEHRAEQLATANP